MARATKAERAARAARAARVARAERAKFSLEVLRGEGEADAAKAATTAAIVVAREAAEAMAKADMGNKS